MNTHVSLAAAGATNRALESFSAPDNLLELDGWRPEQMWLSRHCGPTAHGQMAQAVASAVDRICKSSTSIVPQHELLLVLGWRRRDAAALRLKARILRGPLAAATSSNHDLALSALWLAAVKHQDLLAAVEFAADVTHRAEVLDAGSQAEDSHLPPGIRCDAQLANLMRRRGREVLARHLTWTEMDSVGRCLGQALLEDPLRKPDGELGEVFA